MRLQLFVGNYWPFDNISPHFWWRKRGTLWISHTFEDMESIKVVQKTCMRLFLLLKNVGTKQLMVPIDFHSMKKTMKVYGDN